MDAKEVGTENPAQKRTATRTCRQAKLTASPVNPAKISIPAVTNARFCCVPRVAGSAPSPLDRTRSTSQAVRSSRAGIRNAPYQRRASVCGSAAGVSLHVNSAMCAILLSAPLAIYAAANPQTEAPESRSAKTLADSQIG